MTKQKAINCIKRFNPSREIHFYAWNFTNYQREAMQVINPNWSMDEHYNMTFKNFLKLYS